MRGKYEEELIRIIKKQNWLMEVLRNARDLRLPDWYIAAGTIRNTIWNYLHDFPTHLNQNDVDVIYFDSNNLSPDKDIEIWKKLCLINSKVKWEVVNQARAHLIKPGHSLIRPKVSSSCESISYWSETANCIGIRLEDNDNLTICAPYGLDDLFNLIIKPIPEPFKDIELYRKRIREKKWKEVWPKLKILYC